MKIIIGANSGGFIWGHYVTYGTKNKPRNLVLIEIMEGNPKMGDRLTAQGHWKENEYNIILGFKGKPDKETVRKALADFKKHFMAGFDEDEYHFDAVGHFDTEDTHIHIRIPKINLRTGTQLQLYFHAKDVNRINLIRDHINYKYDLDVSVDEKPLIAENKDIANIQKWRGEAEQEPLVLKGKKKDRDATQLIIYKAIKDEHDNGGIESLDDLRLFFEEKYPKHTISNDGYDIPKDFHYFTIKNEQGDTMRLKGDFYSQDFWNKSKELRIDQFTNNTATAKPLDKKVDVAAKLDLATKKREEEINKKYKKARERVSKRIARQEAIVNQAIGRDVAREQKIKEDDEFSGRNDQTIRSRIGAGEAGESRRESGVHFTVAELVSDGFTVDTGRSEVGVVEADSGSIEGTAGSVFETDRDDSIRQSRERAFGYYAEIQELDEEHREAVRVEAESEHFEIEFGGAIKDGISGIKRSLNKWAESYLEENGRKIGERVERFAEHFKQFGTQIGEWLSKDNKPLEYAPKRATIEEFTYDDIVDKTISKNMISRENRSVPEEAKKSRRR